MYFDIDKPIPVPCAPFVEKNGSNTLYSISSGMPPALSLIVTTDLPSSTFVVIMTCGLSVLLVNITSANKYMN